MKWGVAKETRESIWNCRLPASFKVALATYQFEWETEFWWETVKPWGGEPPITWEWLKELMDAKYYPRGVKRAKEQEFISLK